jgi:hypothetical protein
MPRDMTRRYVSSVPQLDIRALIRRHGKAAFAGHTIRLVVSEMEFSLNLTRLCQPLGGERVYFLCHCRRRVDFLYCARGRFACRKCQRLHYWSQALGPVHRRTHALIKRRRRLGQPQGSGLLADFPAKPKWMRWRTYERLAAEARRRELDHWCAPLPKRIARMATRSEANR